MNKVLFIAVFLFFSGSFQNSYAQDKILPIFGEDKAVFVSEGNWEDSANWKFNKKPKASSKVILKANVTLSTSVSIRELDVDSDVILSISSPARLSVLSTVENNGNVTGSGELVLNGTSVQYLKGNGSYEHLRLNNANGVHLSDPTSIFGSLYVDAGTLSTQGQLSLRCNFDTKTTAQVAKVSGEIIGEVSVEQCYPARRANRLVSPSVTTSTSIRANWQEGAASAFDTNVPKAYGTHITGLNPGPGPAQLRQDGEKGFDFNPSGLPSMFQFVNQDADFKPIDNTDVSTLEAGSPYMLLVRGDRSINIYSSTSTPTETRLRAKGELVSGNYSHTDLSQVKNGFSLIGNPYHAQVDMNSVLSNSVNLRNDVYYVWDPKLGGIQNLNQEGGRGAFVVVELPSGTNSSNSEANQYLQPMQAAFVQTLDNSTSTKINFSENDKRVGSTQTQILTVDDQEYIDIQLYNELSYTSGSTPSDALRINFGETYSKEAIDDVSKLPNVDENFTRVVDQQLMALERRPFPEAEEVLPLYVDQYRRETYVLNFDWSEGLPHQISIVDHYLTTETPITKDNNTYTFQVNSSIAESKDENRFSLKISPVNLSTSRPEFSELKVSPNPTRGAFSISGFKAQADAEISIFNMIGQKVYTKDFKSASHLEVNDFNAVAGLYVVKLTSGNAEQSFKLIKHD